MLIVIGQPQIAVCMLKVIGLLVMPSYAYLSGLEEGWIPRQQCPGTETARAAAGDRVSSMVTSLWFMQI